MLSSPMVQSRGEVTGVRQAERVIERAREGEGLPGTGGGPVRVAEYPERPGGVDRAGDHGGNEPVRPCSAGIALLRGVRLRSPLEMVEGHLEVAGIEGHDA